MFMWLYAQSPVSGHTRHGTQGPLWHVVVAAVVVADSVAAMLGR